MSFQSEAARSGPACAATPPADRRNGRRIIAASALWAVVFVASSWVLGGDSVPAGGAAWAIAALCVVLGLVALAAYRRYLLEADELTRRIQLEGVAFGFGAGLVFSLTYELFRQAGAPDIGMTHGGTVLVVGYIVGVLRATHQYS